MSDIMINDSVPVDKKLSELIRYNIFIMKVVEFVMALILNIIPLVVNPVNPVHCLVAAPTLMLSVMFMVLYVVDQVQYEAEMYYVVIEMLLTCIAFIQLFIAGKIIQDIIYGIFYIDLIVAFALDMFFMRKERGWTF